MSTNYTAPTTNTNGVDGYGGGGGGGGSNPGDGGDGVVIVRYAGLSHELLRKSIGWKSFTSHSSRCRRYENLCG